MTFSQALVLLLGLSSPALATSPDAVTCDASSGEHCAALEQDASEEASDLAVNLLQSALRPHIEKESKQTEKKANMFWKRGLKYWGRQKGQLFSSLRILNKQESKQTEKKVNMFGKAGLKHWGRQKGQLKSHREWKGRHNRFSFLRTLNKQTENTGQAGAAATKKKSRQFNFGHAQLSDPPECVQGWIDDCLNERGDVDCACLAAGNVSTCDDQLKQRINEFVAGGCEKNANEHHGEHNEEHRGDKGLPECVQGWIHDCLNEEGMVDDCACLAAGNVSTCDDELKQQINEFVAGGCEYNANEHHGEHNEEHRGDEGPPDCLQGWIHDCFNETGDLDCACLTAGDVSTCDDDTKRSIDDFVASSCVATANKGSEEEKRNEEKKIKKDSEKEKRNEEKKSKKKDEEATKKQKKREKKDKTTTKPESDSEDEKPNK